MTPARMREVQGIVEENLDNFKKSFNIPKEIPFSIGFTKVHVWVCDCPIEEEFIEDWINKNGH